jgi:hypothetical protein
MNRELGDDWGVAVALDVQGWLATRRGDYARSEKVYEESLARSRQAGDKLTESIALSDLGWAAMMQEHYDRARDIFRQCLELSRQLRYDVGIALSLEGLACVTIAHGQDSSSADLGVRLFGAAAQARNKAGSPAWRQDRAVHERMLAQARARMGDSAYGAAFAAGRAMTPAGAAALANGTDR